MLKADLESLEIRVSDLVSETVDVLAKIEDTTAKVRKLLDEANSSLLEAQNILNDFIAGDKMTGENEHGQIQM